MPYAEMQRLVDGQWGAGFHNYFKSCCLPRLDDAAIETLLRAHEHAASPETKIQLYHFGGAVARVARDETAFAQRDAPYLLNIATRWTDPAESDLHISWARELHAAMTPFATGGVYVNSSARKATAASGPPTVSVRTRAWSTVSGPTTRRTSSALTRTSHQAARRTPKPPNTSGLRNARGEVRTPLKEHARSGAGTRDTH